MEAKKFKINAERIVMIEGDGRFEIDYGTASALSSMLSSGLAAFLVSRILPDETPKYLALLPAAAVYLWMMKRYGDKV